MANNRFRCCSTFVRFVIRIAGRVQVKEYRQVPSHIGIMNFRSQPRTGRKAIPRVADAIMREPTAGIDSKVDGGWR